MVTSSFGKAIRFQNNKSDSNLFTYVLPFHYNVPSYNIDYQILVYRRYTIGFQSSKCADYSKKIRIGVYASQRTITKL